MRQQRKEERKGSLMPNVFTSKELDKLQQQILFQLEATLLQQINFLWNASTMYDKCLELTTELNFNGWDSTYMCGSFSKMSGKKFQCNIWIIRQRFKRN